MYTFLDHWRCWLDDQGIPHTDDLRDDFDVLFVNSWVVPFGVILRVKRSRSDVRVAQRVDGSARDYGRFDDADDRQARVSMLADLVIFQSRYSRYSTTEKFKVIRQDGPVIYNPVDAQVFCPGDPSPYVGDSIRVCNAAYSTNPKKGTWKIGQLAQQNPDVTFVLCGRYPSLPDVPNIKLLGHLGRAQLANVMRSCHTFLNLSENDPCPNVVLEALASGLPVLYVDSGGTPELVETCGLPVTVDSFRQQLDAILKQRGEFSEAAHRRAVQYFAPDRIFSQYLQAIAQARRRPIPSFGDLIRANSEGYPVLPYRPRQLLWCARRWFIEGLFARVR